MRILTDSEIDGLVRRAVAGKERGSFDDILGRAIFEGEPPQSWGSWPREAIEVWRRATNAWMQQALRDEGCGPRAKRGWSRNVMTLPESWDVIVALAPNPAEWWMLPRVSWAVVARHMQVRPRVASYRLYSLGWRFEGRYHGRRVEVAPCQVCGLAYEPPAIVKRHGPCCRVFD